MITTIVHFTGRFFTLICLILFVGAGIAACGRTPGSRHDDTRLDVKRYKVEAVGFKALDETWYDGPFISDEVFNVTTFSRVFGDVDTGESRSFEPNQSCILPITGLSGEPQLFDAHGGGTWMCSNAGVPGPFSFEVEMYEEDGGVFHDCLSSWPLGCGFGIGGGPDFNDDLIGWRTLEFTAAELAAAMPNVGDTVEETVKLGPCHDERGCVISPGLPTGPEYTFTYRLTRLPNASPGVVLD